MTLRLCAVPGCPYLIRWATHCPQHRTEEDPGVNLTRLDLAQRPRGTGLEGSERVPLPRTDLPAPDRGDPGTELTCRGRRTHTPTERTPA